jgi:GDP-L-fucose synthase
MIPSNHETLKFPLNIEDRNIYLQNKINQILSSTIKFNVKENKNSINLSFSSDKYGNKDTFIFLSSKDCDLRDTDQVYKLFGLHTPDVVVHLASRVGGVYDNMNGNYRYLIDNSRININIVDACQQFGVKRLINCLSTCIFPDKGVIYPLTSDQLHNSLPHDSNIGYAYSKRILHLASHLVVKNGSLKVINVTPTNLYGEYDNYNLKSSHVIPGLIHKTYLAKNNGNDLTVYGTGNAMRQFLYVDDFAKIILKFIDLDTSENEISCIVSPPESDEVSIKTLIETITKTFDFSGQIVYDTTYSDGQYKKTATNMELFHYFPDFEFTNLQNGLKTTVDYFYKNYDTIRK